MLADVPGLACLEHWWFAECQQEGMHCLYNLAFHCPPSGYTADSGMWFVGNASKFPWLAFSSLKEENRFSPITLLILVVSWQVFSRRKDEVFLWMKRLAAVLIITAFYLGMLFGSLRPAISGSLAIIRIPQSHGWSIGLQDRGACVLAYGSHH